MCISTPKIGASNVPAPTDVSANNLQLGSSAIINRSGGILGRLALTGGQRSARNDSSAGSPTTGSSDTSSSTPGGTLGLPSDFLGRAVFGGLAPKP